jgi:hypothetical protein
MTIFLKLIHSCNSIPIEISSRLAWLYISVIPALGRVREEDHIFEDSLDCIKRRCLKEKKKKKPIRKLSTIFLSCSKEHIHPKIHVGMQMKKKKKF